MLKTISNLIQKAACKLPSKSEITPVFSTIVFVFFSWSLYRMFWQVPSWLYYLNVWDVLILAAYVVSFALFESLVVLVFLLFLAFILPAKYLKDNFITQGSWFIFLLGVSAVALQRKIGVIYKLEIWQIIVYPVIALIVLIILTVAAAYIFKRYSRIARLVTNLADRMTVFAYIYVPIGLLGLAVVIWRNIF
jgi:hypothetical protein